MKLGLTGGIGCGKSTALAYLHELGWLTLQADEIAKKLLQTEADIITAIHQKWPQVLNKQHAIERSALAQIVFCDPHALGWLETLLHPHVRRHWQQWLIQNTNGKCVVEIPLLFEKELQTAFDATVCIAASHATQLQRMHLRGFTPDQVAARAERQWPLPNKIAAADFIIWNDGNEDFLKAQLLLLDQTIATQHPD
jgi:dephospho-CoA kinase